MAEAKHTTKHRAKVIPQHIEMIETKCITLDLDVDEAEAIAHFLTRLYRDSGKSLNPDDHRQETSLNAAGARVIQALAAIGYTH